MLVVDVVLIGILLVALLVGVQRGLLASLGALIGLVLGGFAAFWLVPIVNDVWPWQNSRVIAVIALAVALMLGGAAAGGAIGALLRRGVDRSTPLRVVDRVLGGALAVLAGALSLSLIASSVAATGTPGISTALASSQVLRAIDTVTPRPVAETLARVRSAVLDDGLPQLGVLLDLDVQPTAPPVALDDPELAVAAASVARVSGVAYACGTSATGSGFVARARPRRHERARRRRRDRARSSNCRVSPRARDASCTSTPSTTSRSSPSTTSALTRYRSSLRSPRERRPSCRAIRTAVRSRW